MTPIGKMRVPMQWQQLTTTQDTFGQPVETWTTVATVWAFIRPLNSREVETARELHAYASHQITMRWPGVALGEPQASDRFLMTTASGDIRTFNATSVLNTDERNRQCVVIANEMDEPRT